MNPSLHQIRRLGGRFLASCLLLFVQVCLLGTLTGAQAQTIRYVKEGGTGEGLTWDDASGDLRQMIQQSQSGDQIWVAAGKYTPGDERYHTFSLVDKHNFAIYGGFEGNETTLAERKLTFPSSTTLSGEIGDPGEISDNSYKIMEMFYSARSTILDGLVFSGAHSDGNGADASGGGILIYYNCGVGASPTIRNCYFTNNQAIMGGAIYVSGENFSAENSRPLLINCVFFDNQAIDKSYGVNEIVYGSGGAIVSSGAELTMINCTLVGNRAKNGNAIRNEGALTLTNSILWNNRPNYDGEIQGDDGLDITGAGTKTVTFSINQDNLPGQGNQTASPAFVDEANGDLRLTACSFAINSGNLDSYTAVSGPDTDLAGKTRVYGDYIDRGAIEFQGESDALFFINPTPLSLTICSTPTGHLFSSEQQLIGLGGKGPVTYQFYKDGVKYDEYTTSGDGSAFQYTSDMTSGEYRMVVSNACSVSTAESSNAITSEPFNLTVIPHPTVTIVASATAVCAGTSATLTASGGGTYLWNTGETTAIISVTATGTYKVTVTNSNGCFEEKEIHITVAGSIPAPTLSSSPAAGSPGSLLVLQNSPTVSLTASGCSGTLVWTGPGSPTGSTVSVSTSATGTFAYSVSCQQGSCTSPATTFTVVVTSAVSVTGSFDGFLYGADCSTFRGWAWDRNKPNTVFTVDIYDSDTFKGTIAANEFRQDLKDAGKGNGIHAFRWTIPAELKDGQVHSLSARISGSGFTLKDGPKTIQCQTGTPPPPANKPPVAPTGVALTAQKEVSFTTTLPVFTDPEGSTLSYGLAGLPTGLTFTSGTRQITGKPEVEGLFVLTYSATDPQGATNSVSFNLTVAGSTTVVTGDFEGYLDKVECGTIRGWVWDRKKPNTPVTVEFYTGSTVWGSVVANIYRVDLLNAGKGNGIHAYSFDVPSVLKDNITHLISARVSGSTYVLKDSGKPLTCSPPAPVRMSAVETPDLQVTMLGNPVSDRLTVEIRGAEGLPVRLTLMNLKGQQVTEQWVEKAGFSERQTLSLSGQPAGMLLLRVSSGSRKVTLKVLKP
ncbi:putative Ig domain-containing protein [Larkinella rosea]|uniref:Dystroglycan-type cadherin-like domain-containing protein n=1 Tax=Larkinella rosea TaxID=2025312 RepID=A0A3P1C361_9BACT|nr:putative Ig domain-containing protein [Larkinella rosea]RRB07821.1 hypothetical protein EHT25_08615 [Larkinella rosea]